ncbi:RSCA1 protein, partial [Atlantisia rogersi]|nr:RSCA1 protein [Atlantisia rogersi]
MPSLPASDGFQNPVQSSGLNSKICNPTNQLLDRSVSAPASICSSESSLAEPIDPRAVKSSTECQITPDKERPPSSQHLSSKASLAKNNPSPQPGEVTSRSPACLSQKTLKESFVADSLKECKAKEQDRGEEHPLEVTEGNSLADTAAKHGQNKDVCLSLEQAEQEQKHELHIDHQMCKEPEKEHLKMQTETANPEPSCHVGGLEKPVVEEASQPENLPMETRGEGLEKAGLPCAKGSSIQISAACSRVHTEAVMEIDVTEQPVAAAHSSASEQKQQAESKSMSGLSSGAVSMEVESLKSVSSLSDPFSTSNVLHSESISEIPVKYELPDLAAVDSSSSSSIHQLDTDPGRPSEEPCFSLASALKELHKLLVISQKGECKSFASEEISQLEMVHREPAAQQGHEQQGSDSACQEQQCSIYEMRSEGGRAEEKQPRGSGNIGAGSVAPVQSALEEAALESQRFPGKSDLVLVNSAVSPDQQQSSEQAEVLAEGYQCPASLTREESTSVSSEPAVDEGAPPDPCSTFAGAPGRSSSSAPEGPWLLGGGCEEPPLIPPASCTGLDSSASPPPAFPAANVDRILSAGFTTQEALEALEQADGNTDLALLILLAKSIVVPT